MLLVAMRRLIVLLLAFVAATLAMPEVVSAHASLKSSSPSPQEVLSKSPTVIDLVFNETVTPAVKIFKLTDDTGSIDVGVSSADEKVKVTPVRELKGTAVLVWHVVSLDGHPMSGVLRFQVGTSINSPPDDSLLPEVSSNGSNPSSVVLKYVSILSLLLAAGLSIASLRRYAFYALTISLLSFVTVALDYVHIYGTQALSLREMKFNLLSILVLSLALCFFKVFKSTRILVASVALTLFVSRSLFNGHHVALGSITLSIAHLTHILASGVWVASLLALSFGYKRYKLVSTAATVSVALLLPSVAYLFFFYKVWSLAGVWEVVVLLKVLLVSVALSLGLLNNLSLKKSSLNESRMRKFVKYESIILSLVLLLSLCLSTTSPSHKPLSFDKKTSDTSTASPISTQLSSSFDDGTKASIEVQHSKTGSMNIMVFFDDRPIESVDSLSWSATEGTLLLEGSFLKMGNHFHAVIDAPPGSRMAVTINGVFDTFTPGSLELDAKEMYASN